MIAVRLYPREHWESELKALGCHRLEGKGDLNTAEWWVLPRQHRTGFLFTVPVEGPDGRVGERELGMVIGRIKDALAPLN